MKLLRFLQSGEFIRVGGIAPIKVDVRIISATNQNLEKLIENNKFRSDLHYRINTVSINLPSLRERKDDIPLLIEHFLIKYSKEDNIPLKKISKEVYNVLYKYQWPGNVRELENLIRAVLVLSRGNIVNLQDLPAVIRQESVVTQEDGKNVSSSLEYSFKDIKEKAERDYLLSLLKKVEGNISKASKIAGFSRRHLYDKLKQYGIDPRQLKIEN